MPTMTMNKGARRLMHVMQSPTTSIPTSLNVSQLVKAVPELNSLSKEEYSSTTTSFEVVGSSLLRVGLAPSTSLYTKRNSLIATFGQSVVSTLYVNKFLPRLLSLQRPFGFQKVISATPVCSLISSSDPLSVISLDGTIDWVVANPTSLHTFCGEQLSVEAKRKGIFRKASSPEFNHTFLTGRGTVALSGKGQLYKVTLEPGESFLALKNNLIAYSVDFNNRNFKGPTYERIPYTLENSNTNQVQQQQSATQEDHTGALSYTELAKKLWKQAVSATKRFVNSESGKFVHINGPTTLLLQSSVPDFVPQVGQLNLNTNPLEATVSQTARDMIQESNDAEREAKMAGMLGKPEDHLKIATITDGKVSLTSTKDFTSFLDPQKK